MYHKSGVTPRLKKSSYPWGQAEMSRGVKPLLQLVGLEILGGGYTMFYMALTPGRGHEALRRGRWSAPGAEYFLTCVTEGRIVGLETPAVTAALLEAVEELTTDGVWRARTVVVMPDHLHLLVTLGEPAELSAAMRLFKGRTASILRSAGLHWQRSYFDHRLRSTEDRLPVFLYILLNPYRAGLLQLQETWPGYWCSEADWVWFAPITNEKRPLPEWLGPE
jgi:REP element-mobilizing transposase RayT